MHAKREGSNLLNGARRSSAGRPLHLPALAPRPRRRFKNADAAALPPRQMRWSVGIRLLIAPILTFGPILGTAIAVLVYGDGSRDALSTARQLRYASSWVSGRQRSAAPPAAAGREVLPPAPACPGRPALAVSRLHSPPPCCPRCRLRRSRRACWA